MQTTPADQESASQRAAENVSNWFDNAVADLGPWLIWGGGLVLAVLLIGLLVWLFFGRRHDLTKVQLRARGAIILPLVILGVLLLLVTMPVSDTINNSLIGLFGLCIAAIITLGSTTIFANFMAGAMMYHVRSFRPGDYIRIDDHAGRVTAKGLFHVEIQTEDRDLITLPNAYLITNPVRVVRSSGTIIACTVSVGYDTPHTRVRELLTGAIEEAGLDDGFVQVTDLGDNAIHYRACGLLEDTKKLVSARTALRTQVLDALHHAGIEVMSPGYISFRRGADEVIPERVRKKTTEPAASPEAIIFDKADDAERLDRVKHALAEARAKVKELEDQLGQCEGEDKDERKAAIKDDIRHHERLVEYLTSRIARMEK